MQKSNFLLQCYFKPLLDYVGLKFFIAIPENKSMIAKLEANGKGQCAQIRIGN